MSFWAVQVAELRYANRLEGRKAACFELCTPILPAGRIKVKTSRSIVVLRMSSLEPDWSWALERNARRCI